MKSERTLARFGRAALQAGVQHAIDVLQADKAGTQHAIDVLQAEIDSLKAGIAEDVAVEDEPSAGTVVSMKNGWMEERRLPSGLFTTSGLKRGSKEWHAVNNLNARVRYQLKAKTRGQKQRKNSARSRYLSWSPAKRKRWLLAMQAGKQRAAQQRVNGAA